MELRQGLGALTRAIKFLEMKNDTVHNFTFTIYYQKTLCQEFDAISKIPSQPFSIIFSESFNLQETSKV